MILPTMTPKEKVAQIEKLRPYILSIARKAYPLKEAVLKRAARYPAYVFLPETDINGLGKWTVVIEVESKGNLRNGLLRIKAFQKYVVTRSKNPSNIGTGIYLAMPNSETGDACFDFPPHYFNRLRERYIEEKGIAQPDFLGLVKEMFRVTDGCMNIVIKDYSIEKGEDGMYAINRRYKKREDFDNFICYHKHGISLGITKDGYFNYTTYVSNDLLKDNQAAMQKRFLAEIREFELKKRYDPHASISYEETEGFVL